jgi:FKBP-type peptidyl-prolyl cis-trans isomerase 2
MALKNGDFVEIEFTGRIKEDNNVFDTNIEKDAKDADLDIKEFKPLVLKIGAKMLPKGFDSDLEGKEIGKDFVVEISPDKAFGKRDKNLIKMIPTKLFWEQKINPERGMQLALDGRLVKVLSNSGGRTLIDFNNPLAGKDVVYSYKINKMVDKVEDKINALQDFLFKKRFEFSVAGKKVVFETNAGEGKYIEIFIPKFKEILGEGLDFEVKIADVKVKGASPSKNNSEKKEDSGEEKEKKDVVSAKSSE